MPTDSTHFPESGLEIKAAHIDEATEHQVLMKDADYPNRAVAPEGLQPLDPDDHPHPPHNSILSRIVPTGGIVATVFSTAATAAGGGILGLPSAFLQSGAIMGCVWAFLIAMTTAYSLRLLAIASELTGERSYERLAYVLLGKGGTYIVSAMRFLNCFGSMIAYVISIGDLLKPIFKGAGAPSWTQEGNGFRCLIALFWLVCFFPLMLPRRVNALRYISTAGILCIIFFCLCVFVHFCMNPIASDIKLATSGNTALSGIGVILFSFICQVNQVELYREMRPSTVARFTLSSIIASALLMMMYGCVGLFGYLEFGEAMNGGTILAMYKPVQEPQFLVAFIAVFVKLMASYGLFGYVCLSAVYHTINVDGEKVPFWKHFILAAFLSLITLILGLFWPGVETVFNLVGGICGGSLGFILPVLFYMYAGNWTLQTVGIGNYVASYLVLWAGVFALVCGTAVTIYSLVI